MEVELTNEDVQVLHNGIDNILIDLTIDDQGEVTGKKQRNLPMLPSIRLKRMKSDIEGEFESLKEAIDEKESKLSDKREELKDQLDDEDSDYSADDFREDLNEYAKELSEEMSEMFEETVTVSFSDPLTMDDITRIDKTDETFPTVSSSAIDIIMKKVINAENGGK